MADLTPKHIVLVGLMASGKTTVARRVASALGWALRDSDADIEAATGFTVRDLDGRLGTGRTHELEAEHFMRALDDPTPSVVAAAASVVESVECRRRLRRPTVVVVWLRASPGVLAERIGRAAHRPTLGADPLAALVDQAHRRDPLFASLYPILIDTDRTSAAAAAQRVVRAIRGPGVDI